MRGKKDLDQIKGRNRCHIAAALCIGMQYLQLYACSMHENRKYEKKVVPLYHRLQQPRLATNESKAND